VVNSARLIQGVIAEVDHCTFSSPPPARERPLEPIFLAIGVRIRANNRTGAARRFPQPRLVQTLLSALSRLQCGQITFGNDILPRLVNSIMPLSGQQGNALAAENVLSSRRVCTGSSSGPEGITASALGIVLLMQSNLRLSRQPSPTRLRHSVSESSLLTLKMFWTACNE